MNEIQLPLYSLLRDDMLPLIFTCEKYKGINFLPMFTDRENAELFSSRGPINGKLLMFRNTLELKSFLAAKIKPESHLAMDPVDQQGTGEWRAFRVDEFISWIEV